MNDYECLLRSFGPAFDGGTDESRKRIAEEWMGYFGSDIALAKAYMEHGVWDALIANKFQDAGIRPGRLASLKDYVVSPDLLGNDIVYWLCNGDIKFEDVVKFLKYKTK